MNKRKTLGLTQRDIANALGITDQAVSDWERGVRTPRLSPRQTADLCQLMQLDVFQLADMFEQITPKNAWVMAIF
jgi:putative transcriptional regulator